MFDNWLQDYLVVTDDLQLITLMWHYKGGENRRENEGEETDSIEMLKEDLSVELVSKITKLTRDEIEELKKKI
jgi:hypothetical protein